MSADQAKLAHELILVTSAFLRPVDKLDKKAYICHRIGKAMNEAVKRWLTKRT